MTSVLMPKAIQYVVKCVAMNCNMWLITQKAIGTLVFML